MNIKQKIITLFILIITLVIYLQAVTILIAKSFGLKGFYYFYNSIIWLINANNTNQEVFNSILEKFAACFIILILGLLLAARYKYVINNKQKLNQNLHGSARWAKYKDIDKAGLFSSTGVVVGAFQHRKKIKYLIHNGAEHILSLIHI